MNSQPERPKTKQGFTHFAEVSGRFTAVTGAFVVVTAILTTLVPPLGGYLGAVAAWRFGANGVVKYEIGTNANGMRIPTVDGQLYLLRDGSREFDDLRFGDVLQAAERNNFREDNGCGNEDQRNCASSPPVFILQQGECAVVLWRLYEDNGLDDDNLTAKSGGWLRVATASCGIFG